MNRLVMRKRLLEILSKQSFANFYSDNGAFGKWITGEYEKGSREAKDNESDMNETLDDIIGELLR